jgi:predicted nuclease with RNAse H fold
MVRSSTAASLSTVSGGFRGVDDAVAWVSESQPKVIAIDSPKTCAPKGERSRAGERELAREVCGIFWTPEEAWLDGNPFYEWIVFGRELYPALEAEKRRYGWKVIEVFPTASWTEWAGRRGEQQRARWTREALGGIRLHGLPSRRLNQDDRDSIAAARTARLFAQGRTRAFGEIVVPIGPDL